MSSNEEKLTLHSKRFFKLLESEQLRFIFRELLDIPVPETNDNVNKPNIVKKKIIPCGEIDLYISKNGKYSIAIEIKEDWKPSPGQLEQYYNYAKHNNEHAYLILLSRCPFANENKHIKDLFVNQNWRHITWKQFYEYVNRMEIFSDALHESGLKQYLEENKKYSEKKRKTDYDRIAGLPDTYKLNINLLNRKSLANDRPFALWASGDEFWIDLAEGISQRIGNQSFYTNTFDLYHYIFTWAYHKKNFFFDIRKNNKWEYYYDYFKEYIEKKVGDIDCKTPSMDNLYQRYLKISVGNRVQCGDWVIGMEKVDGVECYILTSERSENTLFQRVKCWELESKE